MTDLKTYSVLIAWNDNDREEGEYGATVRATDPDDAEAKVRAMMADDDEYADDDDEPREFGRVVDLHEGAIWKAAEMEKALREIASYGDVPPGAELDGVSASQMIDIARKAVAEIDAL